MSLGDTFNFYIYQSDEVKAYVVKVSQEVANEGGFIGPVNPSSGPIWPYKAKNLRHVWGSDGLHRARLPIALQNDTKYTTGGSFTLHGRTYIIEGQIGERRAKNTIA